MSCGWGAGSQNHWGVVGAYLSGCSDGDMAPGMGFELLKRVLAGCGDRLGFITHLQSLGCLLLVFVLSTASVDV